MKLFNKNKKGAEMTIGTLVIIVLAVLVLALLAFGFGTGWGNLWDKIKAYTAGGVNVDSVKQACLVACTTQRTYEYCCVQRDVRFETGKPAERMTCNDTRLRTTECNLDCSLVTCESEQKPSQSSEKK